MNVLLSTAVEAVTQLVITETILDTTGDSRLLYFILLSFFLNSCWISFITVDIVYSIMRGCIVIFIKNIITLLTHDPLLPSTKTRLI